MTWRTAKSLDVLLAEINAIAPHRDKESDGTIGNAEHASRASRHNPNSAGVVTARDITQDAAGGMDIHHIARLYVARIHATGKVHPDLDYIISDRQTASLSSDWIWVAYHGANPHLIEAHWAVGRGPDSAPTSPYDDTDAWDIASLLTVEAQSTTTAQPFQEDDMFDTEAEARINARFDKIEAGLALLERDNVTSIVRYATPDKKGAAYAVHGNVNVFIPEENLPAIWALKTYAAQGWPEPVSADLEHSAVFIGGPLATK